MNDRWSVLKQAIARRTSTLVNKDPAARLGSEASNQSYCIEWRSEQGSVFFAATYYRRAMTHRRSTVGSRRFDFS